MDMCTDASGKGAIPKEEDITLCLNCSELYIRHSDKWVIPTEDEINNLPDYLKKQVSVLRGLRKSLKDFGLDNLSEKQKPTSIQ